MGSEQSRRVWSTVETLMENEPEAPVVAHEDANSVVLYDPSSMIDNPKQKRKLWKTAREYNTTCKKRLLRVTRGATFPQFEKRQGDPCAALPYQKYNEARVALLPSSCKTCSFVAGCPKHLIRHERTHSGERSFICETCGKCFAQSSGLFTHARTHIGEKPYSCETCGERFAQSSYMRTHNRTHSGEKPYKCEECDRAFSHISSLRVHKRIHSGEKPYKCETCGGVFARNNTLISHERTHSGEKPYKCEECGKCFSQRTAMNLHLRIHSGQKPHTCQSCGKVFTRRGTLILHGRTHSGEKPYKCEECGKCFSQRTAMNFHSRIHSGQKPHMCEQCRASFYQRRELILHIRAHTGEKPYACKECGKTFSCGGNRNKHETTHDRPSAFPCEYQDFMPYKYNGEGIPCGLHFTSAVALGFHIRDQHDQEHVFKMPAELAVREALKETFGEVVQHDWQNFMALGSCESVGNQSYRLDFRTPAPAGFEMFVITEVDEFQHRRYACDLKRMLHAHQVLLLEFPRTPIVFVRWNPDPRKIGKVHFNVPFEERVKKLIEVLRNEAVLNDGKRMSDLVREGLNVIYMYYDLERVDGDLATRVCMLNGVSEENANNADMVRANVIATL